MNEKPVDSSKVNKVDNELDEYEEWKKYTLGGKKYAAYLPRLKNELDKAAAKRGAELREQAARKRGWEQGLKEGLEEGLEEGRVEARKLHARSLLNDGVPVSKIKEYTQLTEEVIMELKSK